MFLKGKRYTIRLLAAAAAAACVLTACGFGKGEEPAEDQQAVQEDTSGGNNTSYSGTKFPEDSILNFKNDSSFARLQEDMNKGDIPIECNVLYDEEGGRPEVTVTDEAVIKEIYEQLAEITVGEKSEYRVTDCYHHVSFRLRNDTYVSFFFEGRELFCWGRDNYSVSGGDDLWRNVRSLQDAAIEEAESSKTGSSSQSGTASSGQSSASAGTQEKEVADEVTVNTEPDRELPDQSTGSSDAVDSFEDGVQSAEDRQTEDGGRGKTVLAGTAEDLPAGSEDAGRSQTGVSSGTAGGADSAEGAASGTETQAGTSSAADTAAEAGTSSASGTETEADTSSASGTATSTAAEADTADAATAADTSSAADTATEADTASTAAAADEGELAGDMMQLSGIDAAYTDIVMAYAEVLAGDPDTFRSAYENGLYGAGSYDSGEPELSAGVESSDSAEPVLSDDLAGAGATLAAPDIQTDPRLNYEIVYDHFRAPDETDVCFGLRDYNEDGIPELVIALRNSASAHVYAMYTFDGMKEVPLFTDQLALVYRTDLFLLPDGTFLRHASGGAAAGLDTICRIADGGSGLEILAEYSYDEAANGNMDHISATGETLTDEEFNETYGDWKDPTEGISFEAVSETAQVAAAPAE